MDGHKYNVLQKKYLFQSFCLLIGKLVLTIPWTNLYKAPWVVRIERVFLLSVPLGEVRYDAEREEKLAQEAKQKELQKVEDAKRQEAERGLCVQPVRLKSIQCIKISHSLYIIKWSAVDTFLAHGLYIKRMLNTICVINIQCNMRLNKLCILLLKLQSGMYD
jgi:hypothetical protein